MKIACAKGGQSTYSGRGKKGVEARSLALHRLVAEKLREDPAKFDCVKATIARWRKIVCENSQRYVVEWERLASLGLDACLAVALEESERATTLRQCSPFGCVLTPRERHAFFVDWSSDWKGSKLESHDDAAARLVAGRPEDMDFVGNLLRLGVLMPEILVQSIYDLSTISVERKEELVRRVELVSGLDMMRKRK